MACRKILMHMAVDKGADENRSFAHYVDYLSDHGYITPDGKKWVDYIRSRGNDANHEISLMTKPDAERLLLFTDMLLRLVYEFPASLP